MDARSPTRIAPVRPEDLPDDLREMFGTVTRQMGFAPNDFLVMAHWPGLLRAVSAMVETVWAPGEVSMELKRLVGLVSSMAAGCQYCVAHNVHGLEREGVGAERLAAVWQFDESPLFTAAERAALTVARGAGQSPNAVSEQDLAVLCEHFTPREIAEIVAVIGMFGFLNRWNATLRVPLEAQPRSVASRLAGREWTPGRHGEP